MSTTQVMHEKPAWRDRGNCALPVKFTLAENSHLSRVEHLWVRRISDNRFEICCIPFFEYDLALGDEIEVEPDDRESYVVHRIVKRSGRWTFRVWLGDSSGSAQIAEEIASFGCLIEWHSTDLLAVDAASDDQAQAIWSHLYKWERDGLLKFETGRDTRDSIIAAHLNPVWRSRANSLIQAKLAPEEGAETKEWEQLWVRQIAENRFEICCVPFFVYDLALGDEVETTPEPERIMKHVLRRTVKQSGHHTFRVWFGDSFDPTVRDEVPQQLAQLGCLMEWYSHDLLAIDAAPEITQAVADFLWQREEMSHLVYETGRTH